MLISIESVRAAASRLAHRLRFRETAQADLVGCNPAVPRWWREGLAGVPIFGEGHISLPSRSEKTFSRPVAFLSASEISLAAGGEYIPLAWIDGGEYTALVRDDGTLPVVMVAPGAAGAALQLAESVVDFLDALMPQSLCRLVGDGERVCLELLNESTVLLERGGVIETREFSARDDLGEFIANVLREALEDGMRPRFCPASLMPIIATYTDLIGRSEAPVELQVQGMIGRLVSRDELVLIDGADLEELVDDAARFLESPLRHGVTLTLARRFADWLVQHPAVDEVYADDETIINALMSRDLQKCS